MKIDKPGIYRDISDAEYRADPCPLPSLTQSLCKLLIERSPEHAWTASPQINPNWKPDEDDKKFDLGNVAHRLILDRGKEFEILDFDNWTTKASKEAREAAHRNGKVAILSEQFDRAFDMSVSTGDRLAKHEDRDAFQEGAAEVMICWQEDGIWFRSLVDWLHDDLRTVDDYKSTSMSVAPHVLGFRAEAAGWHIQAAFQERGLDALDPAGAGRRKFRFITQETSEPYALNVMRMTEHWLTMGRKKVQIAIDIWRRCMDTGKWPGYPTKSVTPDYPSFKEKQWLERELSGEFDESEKIDSLMGG
jgi:hypothetical protein